MLTPFPGRRIARTALWRGARSRTACLLGVASFVAVTPLASAQDVRLTPNPVVGSVSGVVRDPAGQPIRDALVYLEGNRIEARTRADGSYWLPVSAPGRLALGVRKVGYRGVSDKVALDTGSNRVNLEMERLPDFLPSVVTVAARGGLSGLVLDESGNPVPDVRVQAIGAGTGGARTNERGEFFIGVRGGKYMVRFDKAGLRRRVASVSVPKDSGRRMVTTMAIQVQRPNPREGANLFDLNQALMRMSPITTRFVTREDLIRFGVQDAQQVARRFSAGPMTDDECARLDGGPSEAPLWAIDVQEIEFMITTTIPTPPKTDSITPCRHTVWLRR